mmetsp:Transcript_21483/g.37781  ORF Transcript_21483/g.37781 Transcript_21483/m.37781 type:complete len:227 (+) Transcript_21483:383-1063(+)
MFLDPVANIGMSFLCHFWGGSESSTDGPNRFIRNGNLVPVLGVENLGKGFQLLGTNLHGGSSFTFFLLFTDGKHDLQALIKGNLAFFGAQGLRLSGHSKSFTTFRVTDNDPGATDIFQLMRTDLSREGSVLGVVATILGSNFNVIAKHGQGHGDVNVRDAQDDVDVGRDGSGVVEDLDPFDVLVVEAVALPVSSDQVSTRTTDRVLGRRALGAVCLQTVFGCHLDC